MPCMSDRGAILQDGTFWSEGIRKDTAGAVYPLAERRPGALPGVLPGACGS